MPAYSYDLYLYRMHKMRGGTFQNYADKTYLPLTDKEIEKHLKGEQQIGIYPLLQDNTSWLIAADFDGENWINEYKAFLNICTENEIPAYLERSRSGKGGHIWVFFEQTYPAFRSRKIMLSLLEKSGVLSVFDKNSSFDRLFPNQDYLSGKGLGNLIALPLFKKTSEQGNSCFLDVETLQPFDNQFDFLKSVSKISSAKLDELYKSISTPIESTLNNQIPEITGKLRLELNNTLKVSKTGMSSQLINFLKDELNFANVEYFIKKKTGKSTYKTERYFKFIEEAENEVIVPRGFIGRLVRFCNESRIEFSFIDKRKKQKTIDFQFNAIVRDYQQIAIEASSKKDFGVIVAPSGAGKTIIGLKIIADKQQPALIIVHRKQLFEQWMERIETFLGIPKHEIGKIGQGKAKLGNKITVATIQSLSKETNKQLLIQHLFGTVVVDECHHIPAKTYRDAISQIPTYYLYGLTATPFRKHNDGKIIFSHLGEIIAEIKPAEISTHKHPKIIVRNTELDVPFNSKTDEFEIISKILIHDSARNKLILEDIVSELAQGKKVVVITERKEHIETLNQYLKQSFETLTLSGDDIEKSRILKWKSLKEGNYQVLITTGQYFGEGTDLQNANTLFLVYPFSFQGKLIQYIGRVQRSEIAPTIFDYRDVKIDYLNKLFLIRNTYYRKIEKQATLFDDPTEDVSTSNDVKSFEKSIKVPLEELDFRYGSVAFTYNFSEVNEDLEFEVENILIRPELEVLKSYFAKVLKKKQFVFEVFAEFENEKLVSQTASSSDLQRINREVIDSVKFNYVENAFIKSKVKSNRNLLTIEELSGDKNLSPYSDAESLLEDLLDKKKYKHSKQLKYLADRHESSILKIRFVLNPFSFVFLLAGENQFHVVLETLDTEEATYLWHLKKDKHLLRTELELIDKQLSTIRFQGRQAFLGSQPDNFSKIIHDYRDTQKGFIIWKDQLEERIS
ncbi:MAG TPA: DEAD/DEAH box helicase family protein [Bacteroidales bacterium]|nr:DEAD/DEAH box helicase family protein [Bacteroidales bacterium]